MRRFIIGIIGLVLLVGASEGLQAQAKSKKKPVKKQAKTVKKPAPKAGGPVVLGTKQLPGEFGKLGTTYTIGKDRPLNFTLTSAEYRVERLNIGTTTYYPKATEKLLVLRYTVHNPNPYVLRYYYPDLKFTAVDSKDVNREMIPAVAREGDDELLMMDLKPAQKIAVYASIVVPAVGEVPKLIVAREPRAAVVRYDLRGKLKPLSSPYASDTTGATVANPILIPKGGTAQVGEWDVQLDSVSFSTERLNGRAPGAGRRYLVIMCRFKNGAASVRRLVQTVFTGGLRDSNGDRVEWNTLLRHPAQDSYLSADLKPGEDQRGRFFFELPAAVGGRTFTLAKRGTDASHTVAFDISGVQ